jgi:hypothetical protein
MCCNEHVTGIRRCGSALCVSRYGRTGGLVAVDITDPSQPTVLGTAHTIGHAADLAVWGLTAYVAEAHQGVGVYDVSQPDAILEVDRLRPGGKIVALAAQAGLLVVADNEQNLLLFDLRDGHAPLGQISTSHRASGLRLYDRQLWVLDEEGTSVQVLDLADPSQPVSIGEHTGDAASHFYRRFSGDLAFTFHGKALMASRLARAW